MKVNGQLKNAQLEITTGECTPGTKGKIVYQTDCDAPLIDTGTECTRLQVQDDMPIGSIIMWPMNNTPNDHWVATNGAFLSKADYPELYAVLGGYYGESATNFFIPDTEGYFIRGCDINGRRDPDLDNRLETPGGDSGKGAGSVQFDLVGEHCHTHSDSVRTGTEIVDAPDGGSTISVADFITVTNTNDTSGPKPQGQLVGPDVVTPEETRPKNIAFKFLIKVK